MRIPSGVVDQYIYFVAVDATDLVTRKTGLTTFTVYRSRNGGAATAMTTPTVTEVDATNMPGVYKLLLDEDTTIDAGDQSQEMVLHITKASMAPVTRVIELYRPSVTAGQTIDVSSGGVEVATFQAGAITDAAFAADALVAATFAADVGQEFADALLDRANGVETGTTLRQAARLISATVAGKLTIAGSTWTFRNLPDTADRVTATVDATGRTAVTLNP